MKSKFSALPGLRGTSVAILGVMALGAMALGACNSWAEDPAPVKPPEEHKPGVRGPRDGGKPGGFGMNDPQTVITRSLYMVGIAPGQPENPKIGMLALGVASNNLVRNVPVGGIDQFGASNAAKKVEDVFKLTPEQSASMETIRQEFKKEADALEKELAEQQAAIGEKARQLRLKYELRANDVLVGDQKAKKEKLDALAAEMYAAVNASSEETLTKLKALDKDNKQGATDFENALREKSLAIIDATQAKVLAELPAEAREAFQKDIAARKERLEQMRKWRDAAGQFGGGRGRGQGGGEAPKPPRPPEEKAGQF
jgi:hypothetical protein